MTKTNWQDPKSFEMRSTHIAGLQEAVGKIEESIGMDSVFEEDIPLEEVFISNEDRYRIFQAPEGRRNWLPSPTPAVRKNGVIITSGFELDYGGGAIILNANDTVANAYTVDATHTVNVSNASNAKDLSSGKVYRFALQKSVEGNPQIIFKEVI